MRSLTPLSIFFFSALYCCASPQTEKSNVQLSENVGKVVTIVAKKSTDMNAHMIQPPGPGNWSTNYVDYQHTQIVVYSQTPIKCSGDVRITGKVRFVSTGDSDPRRKSYSGHHIDAEKWDCI